jgi:signal transduction histidine kinase
MQRGNEAGASSVVASSATSSWHRRWNPFALRRTRGQWVSDCVVFALGLYVWALYGFAWRDEFPALPADAWSVDITLGLFAVASLWWIRAAPLTVGIILIIPGSLAITASFAVLAGVYRVGSLVPARRSVPLTCVHTLAALPYHWFFPVPGMTELAWVIVILLMYFLSLSLGLLTRSRRQVIEGLRRTAALDREQYTARLSELRREERERIAREMHDVLAHRISLLSVHAGALEYRTSPAANGPGATAEEIHAAATVIRNNAHLAIDDLRGLLSILRETPDPAEQSPPTNAALDLSPLGRSHRQPRLVDVAVLLAEAREAGQLVEADIPDTGVVEATAADAVQRTAYRVVQEGLTNARKHAQYSHVRVEVRQAADVLRVRVTNPVPLGMTDGEIPGTGGGLAGLAERVRLDGGQLSHGVDAGLFVLSADLPAGPR